MQIKIIVIYFRSSVHLSRWWWKLFKVSSVYVNCLSQLFSYSDMLSEYW